jgi:hypothetical protein
MQKGGALLRAAAAAGWGQGWMSCWRHLQQQAAWQIVEAVEGCSDQAVEQCLFGSGDNVGKLRHAAAADGLERSRSRLVSGVALSVLLSSAVAPLGRKPWWNWEEFMRSSRIGQPPSSTTTSCCCCCC